jgi:hypothetical protein
MSEKKSEMLKKELFYNKKHGATLGVTAEADAF